MTPGHSRYRSPLECLLNTHARDGSADHELLDLVGAFEDVVNLQREYPLVTVGAVCGR